MKTIHASDAALLGADTVHDHATTTALAAWIGPGSPIPGGWWWSWFEAMFGTEQDETLQVIEPPEGLSCREWADLPTYHPALPQ